MVQRSNTAGGAFLRFVAVPWGAFVAAFLFYVGVTLVVFSVEDLPDVLTVAAYLLPVAAYVLVLAARAAAALVGVPWLRHATPAPLVR